ncbi:serine/threonine protein kinase [Streptomyces sp. NWU339]|uniref:serine/threonine-protein kinase n=1 Tax=Streptomyces sp. NWU339 TaxID=2185284 RepID=UPI000D675069|nr:serine/threonine-protein kinase [Streptomyces sp. NWU339]PWI04928.1 serine/threonine protein kinase [Streptomyces sp. NWU339]
MASRCSAEVLSGRYRLDDLLGSGGAADVYRGFDLRLKRPVAVKVFRPDTGIDVEENLHSEAVILARLHHPGLVTAYDAGQHNGRVFLVMQLIEGDTLKNRIAQGPLPPQATAALGVGLAHALAHAHEAGIVHRDVKPSNILLDASHRPYLTDFGISRLLDATTRTATGTLIGTAAYLSPEQVLGQSVGRPADVYALGLVLLECLTGRLEYDGGPLEAAIARLHRQPALPPCLPEQLDVLLRDMTALDEQNRPTARDCARTLAALAETARLEAGPSAHATSLITGPGPSQTTDRTHINPLPDKDQAASRTTPSRGRTLVAGATVALAAVMATAFAVTDDSAPPADDRSAPSATSAPTGKPDPPGSAGQKKAARTSTASSSDPSTAAGTPPDSAPPGSAGQKEAARTSAAASSSDPSTAAGTPPDHAPGQSSGHTSPGPNHGSADEAATPGSAATTAQTTPSGTDTPVTATPGDAATETPHRPPGQAKKTEKAESEAQQGETEKTATER